MKGESGAESAARVRAAVLALGSGGARAGRRERRERASGEASTHLEPGQAGVSPLGPRRRSLRRAVARRAEGARMPRTALQTGWWQEGLSGQHRPHEPLEMALTCPSQPTVGAGVTTTGGTAPLHKVGITAHRKEQETPSRGLATFLSSTHKGGSPRDCPTALRRKAGGDGTNHQRWQSELSPAPTRVDGLVEVQARSVRVKVTATNPRADGAPEDEIAISP